MVTCVDDRLVCRLGCNWFAWVEVELLIECQVGCDVWYLLWRSWNI